MKPLEITPGFLLVCGINCYLLGFRVVGAFFAAALLHEAGHIAAAGALSVPIFSLKLSAVGGELRTDPEVITSFHQDLLLALSGPAANIIGMVLLLLLFPEPGLFVSCVISANFLLAAFNLLPVLPLDGGWGMNALLGMCLSPVTAAFASRTISQLFSLAVIAAGVWIVWKNSAAWTLLLLGCWLASVAFIRK